MATHVVRKGSKFRTGVVLKTRQIFISIECTMQYHTSKTTIPYQTPSPLHFMTSFQSEKHWKCVLPQRHHIILYGYCSEQRDNLHLQTASWRHKQYIPLKHCSPDHVILTHTTSYFFTTIKSSSKELWNVSDKSADGSCWENWMTSTSTTSVTLCFTSANETRKEIVLLVTAACRYRSECSTNSMIGTGEIWSTRCRLVHHKSYLDCSGIEPGSLRWEAGKLLSKPGNVQRGPVP